MEEKNVNNYFVNLVIMLASACWQQLGKVPNPVNGKTEVELQNAQVTIDMIDMLKMKTKGNLSKEEEQLINTTLDDLKLNYADEVSKSKSSTEPKN